MRTLVLCAAVLGTAAATAEAQWERARDPSLQWSQDGRPNLFAPAPRVNGAPDLSGVWQPDGEPLPAGIESIEGDLHFPRHMINVGADLEGGQPPMRPATAETLKARANVEHPGAYCKPTGVPNLDAIVLPFKIVQTPKLVLVLHEENQVFRQIFLDGRKPIKDAVPRFMGYSTGHWDADALVVETTGVTDQGWLDGMGHAHTERMRVTERFRRRDAGHLEVQITIDDPGAYTSPFTYTVKSTLVPEDDLLEYFCTENEKDSQHYR
jgi:hypothetical protein